MNKPRRILSKNAVLVPLQDAAGGGVDVQVFGPNERRTALMLSCVYGGIVYVNFGAPCYDPVNRATFTLAGLKFGGSAGGPNVLWLEGEHWALAIREGINAIGAAFPSALWAMEIIETECPCMDGG